MFSQNYLISNQGIAYRIVEVVDNTVTCIRVNGSSLLTYKIETLGLYFSNPEIVSH